VTIVGVVPKELGTGVGLSAEVTARVPEAAEMVAERLRGLGCVVVPRPAAA
jgi:hypothetical protein